MDKKGLLKFLCHIYKKVNLFYLFPFFPGFQGKILSYDVHCAQDLEDYQKRDAIRVLSVIYKYFRDPGKITILDMGCSGRMDKYLAAHVKKVVGININDFYFKDVSLPSNVELLVMDGTQLRFPDETFDFIFSSNVYEHINDLSKCIDEKLRVLRKNGYAYSAWGPIWSSPKGHHIHENMVKIWEEEHKIGPTGYRNNGEFIKDWSHLLLTQEEMSQDLSAVLKNKGSAQKITEYIYNLNDINRDFFDEVIHVFKQKKLQIIFWEKEGGKVPANILEKLKDKYKYQDFSTAYSQVLFAKKP